MTIAVSNYVVECPGCEANCLRDAATASTGLLVLCGTEDGYFKEIPIERAQIQQWQFTTKQVAHWIADKLDLSGYVQRNPTTSDYHLGFNTQGKFVLTSDAYLSLKVNQNLRPIIELLDVTDDYLGLNSGDISCTNHPDKFFVEQEKPKQPSAKQQVSQSETQKTYKSWQKKYRELRLKYPNKSKHSDNWIAIEISKLQIAQGRSKDTIRKNMIL